MDTFVLTGLQNGQDYLFKSDLVNSVHPVYELLT